MALSMAKFISREQAEERQSRRLPGRVEKSVSNCQGSPFAPGITRESNHITGSVVFSLPPFVSEHWSSACKSQAVVAPDNGERSA
jgi:hypothetical protein